MNTKRVGDTDITYIKEGDMNESDMEWRHDCRER
jgi:hypothetical protein